MSAASREIAAFVRGTRLQDAPTEVIRQAKRTLLNFFGCACGGAEHEAVEAVLRGSAPWRGTETATIIGRVEKTDPGQAALINGMSSAVYSFDDTHAEALVHPGGPVACSLLALAQTKETSGSDFLLAFALGAEVVCRLSKSIYTPPAVARPEWVQTGICAGIGAAAGAARLLGLTERETISAMGLASCRASGFRGLSRSMCFSYMAGSAAQAGLEAALLAQAGMSGPEEPLSGEQGFCTVFSADPHPDYLTFGLGRSWELAANTFKPYPCGVVIHPVIEACLSIVDRMADTRAVERIVVEVNSTTRRLADVPQPRDQFEAQTSLQHWAACVFLDREAGVAQTASSRLDAPDVVAMRGRVSIQANEEMGRSAARVTANLAGGETLSGAVAQCRGSLDQPLSDIEIETKYLRQAAPALGESKAQDLACLCWKVEDLPSAATLMHHAAAEFGRCGEHSK